MEIRLLGPVRLLADTGEIDAGPLQQRAVLAALAADAGRPVMVATLVDRVWDQDPPAEARAAMYSYISRLRRLMRVGRTGGHGHADAIVGGASIRLVGRGSGYQLDIDPQRIDLCRFRRLVAAARDLGPDDAKRANLLGQALQLWCGTPMAELRGQWASHTRTGWQQERLDVAVQWAHTQLGLGRGGEVIGPVRGLLDDHPLSEPLAEVLIRALVAAGRDAEALEYFAATRARLGEELGVEPSHQLRAVHQALLRGELNRAAARELPARTTTTEELLPAQLPPNVNAFMGRRAELCWLDTLTAAATSERAPPLVIGVVDGTGGVGKTALVLHWAHQERKSFPDGQLYVNLRGYDRHAPIPPGEVLARFLRTLGDSDPEIPLDADERAARYRTLMAGRRMLVVLDNARHEEQVRPMLPGTGTSVVVVTSRDRLAGLVAVDGAQRLTLNRLPPADAVALLRRLLGGQYGRGDAKPLTELAAQCAFLPLALRIAAERVASRCTEGLARLVAELRDERWRLDLLDAGGDCHAAVRAAFSWSYQHLPGVTARAFRLAGLHPGPDLTEYTLAALLDGDLACARRTIETLARSHLIEPAGHHRYRMHDLLRAYAFELATSHDTDEARAAALTRVLDHYLVTVAKAMALVAPAEVSRHPQVPSPATPSPSLADRPAALRWLNQERSTLAAVCAYTATNGWPTHTVRIASLLGRYYMQGGRYLDLLVTQRQAGEAARSIGDRAAEASALIGVGSATARLYDYPQAVDHFNHAISIFQEIGHIVGESRARGNLGIVLQRMGDYSRAIDHHRQALAHYRAAGDHIGEAYSHGYLGLAYTHLGQFRRAAAHHHAALGWCRQTGFQLGEGYATTALGRHYARQGRYQLAYEQQQCALELFRRLGSRAGEGEALTNLGEAAAGLGRWEEAADHHRAALAAVTDLGDRYARARALNGLAEACLAGGQLYDALTHHAAALNLAELTGDHHEQVRARAGLQRSHG